MDVGFVGLGMMGAAMARNVAAGGHTVRAWNRSPVEAPEGVTLVREAADAFDADVVLTMLSDDGAIRSVILDGGALEAARSGAIHAVTSTISVRFAGELQERHREAGLLYLSAPVFGRPDVAAAGALNVVVAGDPEARKRAEPIFDLIGRKIWVMGDDPRRANAAKIAGNMMIGMAIEALSEAAALTGGYGLERKVFFELMLGTLFAGRAYESYSAKIASGDPAPGFKMELGLKDLRLAAEAADAHGQTLPMLDAVRARMAAAVDAGMGGDDWSAIASRPYATAP